MDPLTIPQAYRFVAIAVMLAEINYSAQQLRLDCELPLSEKSLQIEHVANPFISGFGGTFETKDFSFVFFKSGRLRTISRKHESFQWSPAARQNLLQTMSTTNSMEAYNLASNWLHAVSIDVEALERKWPASVRAVLLPVFPDTMRATSGIRTSQIPVLHVDWGGPRSPAVRVAIFPPRREFLAIYIEDESFSARPAELISNKDALLAIPDGDFQRYSTAERAALVARFATIEVPTNLFPSSIPHNLVGPETQTESKKQAGPFIPASR